MTKWYDVMAMSGAERQRRWMEKNRAIHNLRRRNARKNLRKDAESTVCTGPPERENDRPTVPDAVGEKPTLATFQTKKVGEFRMLVLPETAQERAVMPVVMPVVKPKLFFNDHGVVISESVWNDLQEKKRVAKEKGYEYDPQ